jgi:FlaA1/EpsC-like NDP-sugar epimerase
MGQPVSIAELAQRMVRLRGLRTPADIEIQFVGLRPGEKLHERLVWPEEHAVGTSHPRIMRVEDGAVPSVEILESALRAIRDCVGQQDSEGALDLLTDVIGLKRADKSSPITQASEWR